MRLPPVAAALFTVTLAMPAAADPMVVVPGSNAGYLYFPASASGSDSETQSITIQKVGYTDYTVTSEPAGLTCDATCETATESFPLGGVILKISGNYDVTGITIAKQGTFSGGCQADTATDSCTVVLTAAALPAVQITVPDSAIGAEFSLNGNVVRYAGYYNGSHYAVADRHKGAGQRWVQESRKETLLGLVSADLQRDQLAAVLFGWGAGVHEPGRQNLGFR